MEAAGFTDQVIILNYADQVSADYASVLNIQLTFLASQLSRKKRLIIVLLRSWKMNLNFWNLVIVPSLTQFQANPCWGFLYPPLGHFAINDMRQIIVVGVIKAVDQKAAEAGMVTKSIQKAQEAKWILSLTPATPVLRSGGGTVSKLFVTIDHLIEVWLMIIMYHKTFKRMFCGYLVLCVCGNFISFISF